MGILYLLKVKSSTKIPHFVQIRNDRFELIDYLRLDRPFENLSKYGIRDALDQQAFRDFIRALPFGKIEKWSPRT